MHYKVSTVSVTYEKRFNNSLENFQHTAQEIASDWLLHACTERLTCHVIITASVKDFCLILFNFIINNLTYLTICGFLSRLLPVTLDSLTSWLQNVSQALVCHSTSAHNCMIRHIFQYNVQQIEVRRVNG
jgi:hypothetical protein